MRRHSIAALIIALMSTLPQHAAAERLIRVTVQLPITNDLSQNLVLFKKIVERDSEGAIKIEIHPDAELYKDYQVLGAVASGAIEMGAVPAGRLGDEIPAFGLLYVPFVFNSIADVTKATTPGSPIRTTLDAELAKLSVRPLWWQPFGMAIMLGKKTAPMRPADLKGRKTRAFNETMVAFVEQLGGTPVLVSGSQQRKVYERGDVDFGMTGATSVQSRTLYEVMAHVVVTNHAVIEFVVIINANLWGELSDAERNIITDASRQAENALRASYERDNRDALQWVAENTAMKVHALDEEQREVWREAAVPMRAHYVKHAGPIGESLLREADELN